MKLSITKEEVAFWKKEIEASIEFRTKQFTTRINCDELVRYYEGLQASTDVEVRQIAIINEIFPALYSVITASYYQNPSISVTPTHPKADTNVRPSLEYLLSPASSNFEPYPLKDLLQAALKHVIRKRGIFKLQNQLALFDMLSAGFAVVENSYRIPSENTRPEDRQDRPEYQEIAEEITGKVGEAFNNIKKAVFNRESGKSDEEVAEDIAEQVIELEKVIDADATFTKRWSPKKILFDYRAEVFTESRYIGKEVEMSLSEFNNRFPKHKGQIPAEYVRSMEYAKHSVSENKKIVTVYELEIKEQKRNRVLMVCKGIPEALDHYELPFITDGFSLNYGTLDKYGKIYPMSRLKMMKKAQDDLNHYVTLQMEHADRAMHKVGVFVDGLTKSGKNALHDNDIYGLVEKKVPTAVFEQIPQGGITADNKDLQNMLVENINKLGSTNELAKSGQSDSKFATQDAIKQQSFEISTTGVQDALGDLLRQEVETLKDIIMHLWDGDDYFKITGLTGGDQWYTPEMGALADLLIGDYMVEVDITTAQRPDPLKDRTDALELFNILSSEGVQAFLQINGKQVSLEALNNLIKSFNQNPEVVLVDADQVTSMQSALGVSPNPQGQVQDLPPDLATAPQATSPIGADSV